MEANNARVAHGSLRRRWLAGHAQTFLRDYAYLLVVTLWLVVTAVVTIVVGVWLDIALGRGSLYHVISLRLPPPTPRQHTAWIGWMLVTVAAPSLALAPLGPNLLRPIGHVPKRGLFVLSAGMLLASLMTYAEQWRAAFCSPHGCSGSGVGPLDAIGALPLYRLAPAGIYAMHQTVVALLACFVLATALLVGYDILAGRFIPERPDNPRAETAAEIEAELNNWKVNESEFGWHETGVFDAVADTSNLQATGYRIFAANPRATTTLPFVDAPGNEQEDGEQEPPYPRHFPTYDFTHSFDQA